MIGNIIGEENERLGKLLCVITFVESGIITCVFTWFTYEYAFEIANAYIDEMDTVACLRLCLESLSVSIALLGFALSLQGALKAL